MCHILQATTWKAELQETIQMDLREMGCEYRNWIDLMMDNLGINSVCFTRQPVRAKIPYFSCVTSHN
jgi:hypothetical protein